MCSGSEAGSYLKLIDFVYHSTLGLEVIKKEEEEVPRWETVHEAVDQHHEAVRYRGTSLIRNAHPSRTTIGP